MDVANNSYYLFQNASSKISDFKSSCLEILGTFFFDKPLTQAGPLPKRRYTCLNVWENRGTPFYYTPFDQGALVQNLDPDWRGACNILSLSWLRQKMQAEDFLVPASYTITDSHLPHPMIVGDNRDRGPDVIEIRSEFQSCFGKPVLRCQSEIESQVGETGVKALLEYFKSYETHYTIISSYALKMLPAVFPGGPFVSHACGFAKRGDQCSWFDPNHGEVAFEHFADFARWFTAETASGSLSFIMHTDHLSEDNSLVSQVYDRPRFTESERKVNALATRLVDNRNKATDFKIALIPDYTLETYSLPATHTIRTE